MAKTKEKLAKAIEVLADKIKDDIKADDALKFTQAAANAANTMCAIKNAEQHNKGFEWVLKNCTTQAHVRGLNALPRM